MTGWFGRCAFRSLGQCWPSQGRRPCAARQKGVFGRSGTAERADCALPTPGRREVRREEGRHAAAGGLPCCSLSRAAGAAIGCHAASWRGGGSYCQVGGWAGQAAAAVAMACRRGHPALVIRRCSLHPSPFLQPPPTRCRHCRRAPARHANVLGSFFLDRMSLQRRGLASDRD